MRADATQSILVVPRPSAPRPTTASTIAFDEARSLVWVVNADASSIAVLRADPPALLAEIPVDAAPRTLAVVGDTVAVACQGSGTLVLVDAATRARRATVALGAGTRPFGVTGDPRGGRALVTLQDVGRVVVVDLATAAVTASVDVGPDPRAIAMNADGDVLVTRWRSAQDGARVALVDARDPAAPALSATAVLAPQTGLDTDTDNNGVPSFLAQVVFAPDGARAIVAALKANVVTGMFRTGARLTFQSTARGILSELALGARGEAPMEVNRFPFDDLDATSAVVFSPEGARIYASLRGSEAVIAVGTFGYDMVGSVSDVGMTPEGLAVSPDGRMLYVQALLSRSVRAYDVSDLSREPSLLAEVVTLAIEPLAPDVLAGKRIFYRSRDPRMSQTSYLSCATCHLDGEGDNLVWDFTQRGEGLRNTISLAGRAGAGHGPMHWSANFDEVQDFEGDIRNGQGGTGFLSEALYHAGTRDTPLGDAKAGLSPELDQLAAYVSSLTRFGVSPARRTGDAAWTAARARGEAIFRSATTECATCHSGSRFTDSAFGAPATPVLHDVGTLGPGSGGRLGAVLSGIDTPTLRGLWRTAPYLHDGSAATLRDVLTTQNAGDRHGTTSALSAADLDDLELYLSTLDDLEP